MTTIEQLHALNMTTGSRGWQDILLPEFRSRYESALNAILHTPGQTDANIHKAAGLASAYDYLIKGIPEFIENLRATIDEEKRAAEGDVDSAPPIL